MPPPRSLSSALRTKPFTIPPHHHRIPIRPYAHSANPPDDPSSSHAEHPEPHSDHYDPPSGWLWGVPPGEKYKREGWEIPFVYGFWGSIGLAVVAYAYKPDTSIQTWALEEARRRLEAEGILPDPHPEGGKK